MKTSGKNIGIILLASLLLGGAGFGGYKAYKWWKKRKQGNTDANDATSTTTSGTLWTTRTAAETTAIQQKINALYNADRADATVFPGQKTHSVSGDLATALKSFKNMMGGTIAVDGKYGGDTYKAVRALQTFLKTLKVDIGKSGIDGKYGKDTDKATGWNILK